MFYFVLACIQATWSITIHPNRAQLLDAFQFALLAYSLVIEDLIRSIILLLDNKPLYLINLSACNIK